MPNSPAISLLIVAAAASLLAGCIPRKFVVPTSSMEPTIPKGANITADMSAYTTKDPQRWDIVLFDPPSDPGKGSIWAKRVVALPGETISYGTEGGLLVNGQPLQSPPELASITWKSATAFGPSPPLKHPYTVPTKSYYVLGDDPDQAYDSRFWGSVPRSSILGKVISHR